MSHRMHFWFTASALLCFGSDLQAQRRAIATAEEVTMTSASMQQRMATAQAACDAAVQKISGRVGAIIKPNSRSADQQLVEALKAEGCTVSEVQRAPGFAPGDPIPVGTTAAAIVQCGYTWNPPVLVCVAKVGRISATLKWYDD